MKLVSRMILLLSLFLVAIIVAPTFVSATSDKLSTFLLYTDYSSDYSRTIYEGDSISFTTVAISHDGRFSYEQLEIVGGTTLFKEYKAGDYISTRMYSYDRTYLLRSDVLGLAPGTYTIKFTAETVSGEKQSRELTLNVLQRQDTISPIVSIRYPTNGMTYTDYVDDFEFKAVDDNLESCSYSLNGASQVAVSCQDDIWKTVSIQTVRGLNTLTVYARDESGNVGSKTISFRVEIEDEDTISPVVSIRYPTNGMTYTDYVDDFEFKAVDDNLYTCSYSLNGASQVAVSCQNDIWKTVSIQTIRGLNTLTVYARDLSGNVGSKTISFRVEIDDQSPIVQIHYPENNKLYTEKVEEFSFVAQDDNLKICWYKLNDRPTEIVNCDDNVMETVYDIFTIEGWNTLTVYAKDDYENVGSDTVQFRVDFGYQDDEAPIVNILYPENKTYDYQVNNFSFTVEEEFLDNCWYVINGNNVPISSCTAESINTVLGLSTREGENTLRVYARDLNGNIGHDEVVFRVEAPSIDEPPIITVITPTYNGEYRNSITFDVRVNEEATVVYSLSGASNVAMTEVSNLRFNSQKLYLADGNYEVTFCATDLGGNVACKTVPFKMVSDDEDCDDDCCTATNLNDFRDVEDELDKFYEDKEAKDKAKRLSAIRLGYDDEGKLTIEISFGEKVYYGIVGYIVLLIILVMVLFYIVEKRKRR